MKLMLLAARSEKYEGRWRLSTDTLQRVGYAAGLLETFSDAELLLSGGYAGMTAGEVPDESRPSLARLMADELTTMGYARRVSSLEEESYSTVTNLTFSLRQGLIQPDELTAEDPLNIITHPYHMRRVNDVTELLDIPMHPFSTPERDSRIKELLLRTTYKAVFLGLSGAARGGDRLVVAAELEDRERLAGRLFGRDVA